MKRSGIGSIVILLAGCGSSEKDSGPLAPATAGNGGSGLSAPSGGSAGSTQASSGSGGTNAAGGGNAGSGGSSPEGGAGGEPQQPIPAHPPGAVIEQSVEDGAPLTLLSSNLEQWSINSTVVEWYGEVRNDGTTIACRARAEVEFLDASDTVVWSSGIDDAPLYASPYLIPEFPTEPFPCLAPGEAGVLFDDDLIGEPLLLDSITRVVVVFYSGEYAGAVPHPDTPTLANVMLRADGNQNWDVVGDITAVVDIREPLVNVFMRNSTTSYYEGQRNIIWTESQTLVAAGETFQFDTAARQDGPYSELSTFVTWSYPPP